MSSYYQIFLRTPEVKEQLIADIANAAECELGPGATANNGYDFAGRSDTTKIQVELSHEFDDDYGIPFSQYQTIITVIDLERNTAREEMHARTILRRLAKIRKSSMLLVHDISTLIDRYDP